LNAVFIVYNKYGRKIVLKHAFALFLPLFPQYKEIAPYEKA